MNRIIALICLWLVVPSLALSAEVSSTVFLEELTWTEVRDALKAGKTTILFPTGGTEQNGPHMVLGKHNFIIKYSAEQIALRLGNTLVAPVLAYVPEGDLRPVTGHMLFPGTITLPDEYFMKVTEYAARSFRVNGFKDIVLLGDSGGNQPGLASVADMLNKEWANSDVRVHFVQDYYTIGYDLSGGFAKWLMSRGEKPEDIGKHAGIMDTSVLMAIYPEMIRMDELAPGGDFKLTGVMGDPTRASVPYGRKGLELKITTAVDQIQKSIAGKAAKVPSTGFLEELTWTKVRDALKTGKTMILDKALGHLATPFESWESILLAISQPIRVITSLHSNTGWPYLASSLIIAWVIYLLAKKKNLIDPAVSFRNFAFPREVYTHRSAIVDYKFVAINLSIKGLIYLPLLTGLSAVVYKSAIHVLPLSTLSLSSVTIWTSTILSTFAAIIVTDFGAFLYHYLMHKIPLLWLFHQTHHSAEVLTPVTVYRFHPVEDIFLGIVSALLSVIGPATYSSLSGQTVDMVTIFGVNAIMFLYLACAVQLRHSHLWLSYGPLLSWIFISPAQHQIHHSMDPKHWDKNFGGLFAIWDAIFGSLYIPKTQETLQFGVSGVNPQDFSTPAKLYFLPFAKAARMLSPLKPARNPAKSGFLRLW